MNALANEKVGDYVNDHYVSSFLKVGTFTVANGQKQGGNVASYFCLPDGSVLHAIAGPVDADTFLREARWVAETRKLAIFESQGNISKYKEFFRRAHAERLQSEYGIDPRTAAGSGLWVPGADIASVSLAPMDRTAAVKVRVAGRGQAGNNGKQTQIHMLMVNHPLIRIENLYKYVFERILGERISSLPVAQK